MRKPNRVPKRPETITITTMHEAKEIINDLSVYIVEMCWPHPNEGWEVHSMYVQYDTAKVAAKELHRSLVYDREGCGVRMRGGKIDNGGLAVTTRVLWTRMCTMPKIDDVVGRKEEEDEDG